MTGMRGLAGKSVLVTGAARGIGLATAKRLSEEGMRIGLIDLDADAAQSAAAEIRAEGGNATGYAADISDGAAVTHAVDAFEAKVGSIDALVNNAGFDHAADFIDSDPELWRRLIDVNLYGPLHVTHTVLSRMLRSGGGRIVSIASDAARVGSSGESVYAACKAGVIALTKSIAREMATRDVTLNVVSPGPTDTDLFRDFDSSGRLAKALERAIPMRRLGQPGDYPGIVAFLLSDDAGFITGQVISVSGGLTMHG